jgi:hypothetical protein
MPRPPHTFLFDHPKNIWWWSKLINFLLT